MSRRTAIIIVVAVAVLTPAFLVITGVLQKTQVSPTPVSLIWWTTEDNAPAIQGLVNAYRGLHPYVNITVVTKNAATLDRDLKDAWAKNQGPDIFSIPNTATASYQEFITPLPSKTRVAYYRTRNLIVRQEQEIVYQDEPSTTPRQVRSEFVEAVGQDVVLRNGQGNEHVYGLPLAVDTLMLFFNRDLLNSANILDPPTTWEEFATHIPQLTIYDTEGNVTRSAVGLGLAKNVPHAFDILSLLMLQNGTRMVSPDGSKVEFHKSNVQGVNPGLIALEFYTDFAQTNPPQATYTWTPESPDALDLFTQGKLAYAFGYQSDRVRIATAAPTLNFGVAPVPHIHDNAFDNDATAPAGDQLRKITYGRYHVQAVSLKAGRVANEAWNLVQFAARSGAVRNYLDTTKQVAAFKQYLREQQSNPDLAVPANQASALRSWYRGTDFAAVEQYIADLIESVALEGVEPGRALELAAGQVQQTLPEEP
ncbi:MAG: extracellular solute-binding protein [Candidatus Kerfeldbacteria bacterium]|nr:extracellular solute-binding protein [Candidatus Kerfeldbacteria bacterium]